jgi:hypothetical protein
VGEPAISVGDTHARGGLSEAISRNRTSGDASSPDADARSGIARDVVQGALGVAQRPSAGPPVEVAFDPGEEDTPRSPAREMLGESGQ